MKKILKSSFEDGDLFYNHVLRKNPSSEKFNPHFHDKTELIFVKSGDLSYLVGGKKYKLSKNMLVISRPTDRHSIRIDGDSDYERYNILYDEKNLHYNIYEKIPIDVNVINFNENVDVVNIFRKMDFYAEKLSGEDLKKILVNLIEEIFFNVIIEVNEQQENAYTKINPIVCKALEYIDENLLTLTGVEDICKELYITKSYLHQLFQKHLKITPKKYITTKRLALAQRELYAGGKATEICRKYGFSDYSAFFRAYKTHYGKCPSDFD